MNTQKSDTEIIDLVLTYLYNDGKYKRVYLQEILDYHNITHLHDRDIRILSKKFTANSWTQENLITYCGFAEDEINISYDRFPIQLTDFGIQFIKEHKSYSKYQKLILEYKVDMKPRFGYGLKPHGLLYQIINENCLFQALRRSNALELRDDCFS